jgi:hypothetical protein
MQCETCFGSRIVAPRQTFCSSFVEFVVLIGGGRLRIRMAVVDRVVADGNN